MLKEEVIAGFLNTELVGKITSNKSDSDVKIFLFGESVTKETQGDYLKFVNQAYSFFSKRIPDSVLELSRQPKHDSVKTTSWREHVKEWFYGVLKITHRVDMSKPEGTIVKMTYPTSYKDLYMSWVEMPEGIMVCQLEFAPKK